ncbi:hypothetical protein C1891_22995 [Pseudomonas sp. GW456-12-1-14-TSB6]|nr:hypothetical protein C1891_22995 [Pseudomonas sp. GW456-12-1-14-TSB6]
MGMPQWTLCVRFWDAERPGLHSHAERGNDQPLDVRMIKRGLLSQRLNRPTILFRSSARRDSSLLAALV